MANDIRIGVIGAGTMGRGITQLFAQTGYRVSIFDAIEGAADKAIAAVAVMINKAVEKRLRTRSEADTIMASIVVCDSLERLAPCDVVIEAIIEDIGAKQAVFAALEDIVSERAILTSNTSSLVVAQIAAKCRLPGRVAGLHFFNPVPLMRVVEIVAAVRTSAATVGTLLGLVASTGHRAVLATDQPGFLVNHAGRGYYTEALRVLEENVASHAQIDTLLRETLGFRMGPFELLDLTGLDVSGNVMESIYTQFQQEPRFRPSSLIPPRIAAGLYGRKSGEGWYEYSPDGKPLLPRRNEGVPPIIPAGYKVWLDPAADQCEMLAAMAVAAGAERVAAAEEAELVIVQPWGWDASGYCAEYGLDARCCVAVDPLPGLDTHITLMLTALTNSAARDAATALLVRAGKAYTVINDSTGFVAQRVLAMIVNIAANIAQRRIASVGDIEDAVRLGLGYPRGPLTWGDSVGGAKILTILRNMQTATGDPRYRPSRWLVRRVSLGVSLLTEEAARG